MSLCSRVLKGAALAAVVLVPAVAYAADTDGVGGTVVAVTVNESKADDYAVEHGNIIVSEGAVTRKYQWGGTACSGYLLSAAHITLLVDAMKNPDRLQVVPSFKPGNNLARCLVGFKLVALSPSVAR